MNIIIRFVSYSIVHAILHCFVLYFDQCRLHSSIFKLLIESRIKNVFFSLTKNVLDSQYALNLSNWFSWNKHIFNDCSKFSTFCIEYEELSSSFWYESISKLKNFQHSIYVTMKKEMTRFVMKNVMHVDNILMSSLKVAIKLMIFKNVINLE